MKPDDTAAPKKAAPKKKFAIPAIALPKFALPKFAMPAMALPKLALPKLALPKFALPKLVLPKLAIPAIPLPKKLRLPAIAVAALLVAGGVGFGLLHGKAKAAPPRPQATATARPKGLSTACSGVAADLYRQAQADEPDVTLAEVRAEVLGSGIECEPVPEVAAELKSLSPGCRAMVQYTYLGVHDGHSEITVNDVARKVVPKSLACEHDRVPDAAPPPQHDAKDSQAPEKSSEKSPEKSPEK